MIQSANQLQWFKSFKIFPAFLLNVATLVILSCLDEQWRTAVFYFLVRTPFQFVHLQEKVQHALQDLVFEWAHTQIIVTGRPLALLLLVLVSLSSPTQTPQLNKINYNRIVGACWTLDWWHITVFEDMRGSSDQENLVQQNICRVGLDSFNHMFVLCVDEVLVQQTWKVSIVFLHEKRPGGKKRWERWVDRENLPQLGGVWGHFRFTCSFLVTFKYIWICVKTNSNNNPT